MRPTHHILCGWRLRSTLPLPELLPWPGPENAPVDITLDAAAIPPDRVRAAQGRYVHVGEDGSVLLQHPAAFRILTQGGASILVEIIESAPGDDWRLFVLGTALYHLCHQRNLFPLHAATLRLGTKVLAIAGYSGAGKSTLAAALTRHGHTLLSDDTAVLDVESKNGITLLPSFPRLRLWGDCLKEFAIPAATLAPVRPGLNKFTLDSAAGFNPAPVALDGLVFLQTAAQQRLNELRPAEAIPLLQAQVQRPILVKRLGRQAIVFGQAAKIASHIPAFRLERPLDFGTLASTVSLVEKAFQA